MRASWAYKMQGRESKSGAHGAVQCLGGICACSSRMSVRHLNSMNMAVRHLTCANEACQSKCPNEVSSNLTLGLQDLSFALLYAALLIRFAH